MAEFEMTVTEKMEASTILAKVTMDADFLSIVQKSVEWDLQRQQHKGEISSQEELQTIVDLFDDVKKTMKFLEELRKKKIAFPTKVIDMVNGLFRQTKQTLDGSLQLTSGLIGRYQMQQVRIAEEAKRQREEEERKAAEAGVVKEISTSESSIEGVQKTVFDAPVLPIPETRISSTKGAKINVKVDLDISVADKKEFLKLMVSSNNAHFWLTSNLDEIVDVNIGALKKVLKANPGKKKVKGLEIVPVEKAV